MILRGGRHKGPHPPKVESQHAWPSTALGSAAHATLHGLVSHLFHHVCCLLCTISHCLLNLWALLLQEVRNLLLLVLGGIKGFPKLLLDGLNKLLPLLLSMIHRRLHLLRRIRHGRPGRFCGVPG